jgi:hypothetical protein
LTWLLTVAVCTWLVQRGGIQIFFVSLPGWFVAALLYLGLSKGFQRNVSSMKVAD